MKYSYTMARVNHEGELIWVAKSDELKNCYGVGDTQEEALEELALNEQAWLETAASRGFAIPEVAIETLPTFSGKLTLRISPKEHETAVNQANKLNISLNQYLCDAVTSYNSGNAAVEKLSQQLNQFVSLVQQRPELHIHVAEDRQDYRALVNHQTSYNLTQPGFVRMKKETVPCA